MKKIYFAAWALMPLGAWAYHEGPGQDRMRLDDVDGLVREAYAEACDEQWGDAVATYSEALAALPGNEIELAQRIRLERAKAMMLDSGLPEAREELGLSAVLGELALGQRGAQLRDRHSPRGARRLVLVVGVRAADP